MTSKRTHGLASCKRAFIFSDLYSRFLFQEAVVADPFGVSKGGVCIGQSIVHFFVDLKIRRDCRTQIGEVEDNFQLCLTNEDS